MTFSNGIRLSARVKTRGYHKGLKVIRLFKEDSRIRGNDKGGAGMTKKEAGMTLSKQIN